MRIYGTTNPPEYDLTKITVPIAIYYGENDIFMSISVRLFNIYFLITVFYNYFWIYMKNTVRSTIVLPFLTILLLFDII